MSRRRGWPLVAAGFSALAIILVAWSWLRDPLALLPRATGPAALAESVSVPVTGAILRHLILTDPALGRTGLALRLPEPLPAGRLPLVIVLGGLGTGAENLHYVPDAGPNAVIGYDWPVPFQLPERGEGLREAPRLYHAMLTAPGQIAAAIAWAAGQPWADRERISLLAFSLGVLVAPAAQRLAAGNGDRIGWTILAYGGAPIGEMVARHPAIPAAWLRPVWSTLANLAFYPLEPSQHLPYLIGRFLVMGGNDDRLVPTAAFERLRNATPEPKEIVRLEGDHMGIGSDQLELLSRIIEISQSWLSRCGAVRSPG